MEEVDNIIILSLNAIGCDLDEDISRIQSFSPDLVVSSVAKCLQKIYGNDSIPDKLPPSMSAKFRIGTELAKFVSDLGYRGDIGYQSFLYFNEIEIRRIFMFLIEKLPKETSDLPSEPLSSSEALQKSISQEMKRLLGSYWAPDYFTLKDNEQHKNYGDLTRLNYENTHSFRSIDLLVPKFDKDIKSIGSAEMNYYTNHLPFIQCQVNPIHNLSCSLFEKNVKDFLEDQNKGNIKLKDSTNLKDEIDKIIMKYRPKDESMDPRSFTTASIDKRSIKETRFVQASNLLFNKSKNIIKNSSSNTELNSSPPENKQQTKKSTEDDIKDMQIKLNELTEQLSSLTAKNNKIISKTQRVNDEIKKLKMQNEEQEQEIKMLQKSEALLSDPEANLKNLESVIANSADKMASIERQFKAHRDPLLIEYNKLLSLNEEKNSEIEFKLSQIKILKDQIKNALTEIKKKDILYDQLLSESANITKDINRSAYTKRILEIVNNIKKQKVEIDKVLKDTKVVQKEINSSEGKLDRTFTLTDELIFKNAKQDEHARQAYKYLASLHETCSCIINTVEETGAILREIRELEDQLENQANNKIIENLDKITVDYNQIKNENQQLSQKLKSKLKHK